jgi:5-methyltetrahydropteroyltriglutamate--homocysteine methyltransferase
MDYAVAVNEEVRALFEAGADVVQLDEPWLQAHADDAKEFGVTAINKALEGVSDTTGLHLCFGYAAVVKNKSTRYEFLAELDDSLADLISIEAAQPNLDLSVLARLPSKTIVVGVLDLENPEIESLEIVADKVREALRYLPQETAFRKLQAMTAGVQLVRQALR